MRGIIYNRYDQVRSGWKIAILLGGFLAAILVISLIITFALVGVMVEFRNQINADIFSVILGSLQSNYTLFLVLGILQDAAIIFGTVIAWKSLDKKPLRDLGLTSVFKGFRHLAAGLFLGMIAIATVFASLLLTGNITFTSRLDNPNLFPDLGYSLVMFIFVGLGEEILTRGYMMTVLKQTGQRWLVVLLPSIIFALMHGLNPNVSILGLTNTFLVGLLFSYMVVKTGNIWMPIGFHITWNYFQGNIFGFSVSGMDVQKHALLSSNYTAENILNGGAYGPEGGIATTAVLLIFFAIVWKMVDNRKTYWTTNTPEVPATDASPAP